MPLGFGHLRAEPQLQSPPRIPSQHGVQNPARLFAEDFQQSGIRPASVPIGEPRVRGGVRADQDVYDTNELRQGLGRRIPPTGCDLHALLDRDSPARAAAVAGQGPDPDGIAPQCNQLGVVRRRWEMGMNETLDGDE